MSKAINSEVRGPRTMRDIARIAGVSTATVSRALHDSALVDPETAARVRAVIKEANYVPNRTGTALKSGRSGIFGLIIPDISNPFFADFVKHFERQIVRREQEMLLAITDHSPEEMQRSIRRMLMRGVEGLVVLESEIETNSYEAVLHNQLPLVTLNRLILEPSVSDVAVDTTSGMKAAIAYLKRLGHRKFGFFGGRQGQRISNAREISFRRAMESNHLKVNDSEIFFADFTIEGGDREMGKLLAVAPGITAVLCANDLTAIGAIRKMTEHRLEPGKDISVVGLDDINLCTILQPQLTTLRLSCEGLVKLYLKALHGLVRGPHQMGIQFVQEVELVVRGTTGPPRVMIGRKKRRGFD